MTRVRVGVVMVGVMGLVGVFGGCAKRPAMTAAVAPAPSSVAVAPRPSPAPTAPSRSDAGWPPAGRAEPGTAPGPAAPVAPGVAPGSGGAPSPSRPESVEFRAIATLNDIHFDFDRYDIRPSDAKVLDANAGWIKANPSYLILIEGHADERGTNEYNLALGERRAKAALNYLVSQGVPAQRMTLVSYGEERPVCEENTEACWARNRRAHFLGKPQ